MCARGGGNVAHRRRSDPKWLGKRRRHGGGCRKETCVKGTGTQKRGVCGLSLSRRARTSLFFSAVALPTWDRWMPVVWSSVGCRPIGKSVAGRSLVASSRAVCTASCASPCASPCASLGAPLGAPCIGTNLGFHPPAHVAAASASGVLGGRVKNQVVGPMVGGSYCPNRHTDPGRYGKVQLSDFLIQRKFS